MTTEQENNRGLHHTCVHSDRYDFSCGKCIDASRLALLERLEEEVGKYEEESQMRPHFPGGATNYVKMGIVEAVEHFRSLITNLKKEI